METPLIKRSTPEKSAVYSFRYAERVVTDFVVSYARATNFIAKKLHIAPRKLKFALVKQFMYQNKMWNMTRDTIKRVHNLNMYADLSPLSKDDFIKYLTVVKQIVIESWLDSEK